MRYLTVVERNERLKDFMSECYTKLVEKGHDYNPDGARAFGQLLATADDADLHPLTLLYVYFRKHVTSLATYLKHGEQKGGEPIRDRLIDIANYAALIAVFIVWWREKDEDPK